MLVRYQCGCVCYVLNGMDPERKKLHTFRACVEHPGDLMALHDQRDLVRDRKLNDDEIVQLFNELGDLLDAGQALGGLRDAMRVAGLL